MPLPIIIPLAIKGALVVAKFVTSKHMTVSAVKAATVAAKTYGSATTIAGGLTVIGGCAWAAERIDMCRRIATYAKAGSYVQAVMELVGLVKSCHMETADDFLNDARAWVDSGASVTGETFDRLMSGIRHIVEETEITLKHQAT